MEAARWVKEREFREVHGLVVGQLLFALGWSLLWASALALMTFVPISIGLMLMAAGLGVPAVQRWRRRANSTARRLASLRQPGAARAADRPW
jgi:sulfite exporter TauE/SafE